MLSLLWSNGSREGRTASCEVSCAIGEVRSRTRIWTIALSRGGPLCLVLRNLSFLLISELNCGLNTQVVLCARMEERFHVPMHKGSKSDLGFYHPNTLSCSYVPIDAKSPTALIAGFSPVVLHL